MIEATAATRSPDWFCLLTGAILGAVGVSLGAFAAHGLKATLSAQELGWWQTGVQYQFWHAIALLVLAMVPGTRLSAGLMAAGTIIFSGSLYLMALSGARWFGSVTHIGGLLMIAGWVALCLVAIRTRAGR